MSGAWQSVDLDRCHAAGHRFTTIWSDKTPQKIHLLCVTCSEAIGRNAIAAYGDDTKSRGAWRKPRPREDRHAVSED